jgi:hypothetical protein
MRLLQHSLNSGLEAAKPSLLLLRILAPSGFSGFSSAVSVFGLLIISASFLDQHAPRPLISPGVKASSAMGWCSDENLLQAKKLCSFACGGVLITVGVLSILGCFVTLLWLTPIGMCPMR